MQSQPSKNRKVYYDNFSKLLLFLIKKTWWILLIILIFLCGIIDIFQMIPYKIIPGSTDAWLGFWGSIIGTFLSVAITLYVMLYTLEHEATERLHEKMEVIVVNNSKLTEVLILDGHKNIEKIDNNNKVYIEFFNLGKSGVYNINYNVTVTNLESILSIVKIHYRKVENKTYILKYSEEIHGKIEEKELRYINDELKVITPDNIILLEGDSIKIDLPNDLLLLLLLLSEEQSISVEILFSLNYKNFLQKEITKDYTIIFENIKSTKSSNNSYGWNKYFMSGAILAHQEGN